MSLFQKKAVFGEHKEIHLGDFSSDKFGIVTGTVFRERHEEPLSPDWLYLQISSCPDIVGGLSCVGVKRSYDKEKGLGIYAYAVSGLNENDGGFAERVQCSLEGTDTEEPIETHPEFEALYKKYKGRPKPGTSEFGYFEKLIDLDGRKQFNPLFGVTHFLTMTMIWTKTFVVRTLPSDLCARVDCIDTPEGHGGMQPPGLKGKRNWLKMAPVAQQRGNAIQCALRWMASGKNGWNLDIYGQKHGMTAT